jgi:hypothetical protein
MRQSIHDRASTSSDGAIATVTLNNPDKMNALDLGMWQGLAGALRDLSANDDRALRRAARCRRQGVRGRRRHRGIHQHARQLGAGRRVCRITHGAMQAIADCRHPTRGADPGRLRGRGTGDRIDVRHAHLRRIEPLRGTGQPARAGDVVRRTGRADRSSGRPAVALEIVLEGRVFGAARRPSRRVSSIAWWTTPRCRPKRMRPRAASARARHWWRAGTSSSCAVCRAHAAERSGRSRRPTPASTPKTSARASRRSSARPGPCSTAAEPVVFVPSSFPFIQTPWPCRLRDGSGRCRQAAVRPGFPMNLPLVKTQGSRCQPDHGRPVLLHVARRHGGRRHQGRDAGRGRPDPQGDGLPAEGRGQRRLSRAQPQQAQRGDRPEESGRAWKRSTSWCGGRRAGREQPPRRGGAAEDRLRRCCAKSIRASSTPASRASARPGHGRAVRGWT